PPRHRSPFRALLQQPVLLGIRPELTLEQLAGAVETRKHRPERHADDVRDLLHVVARHVDEDERDAVQLGDGRQHRADVFSAELVQEVEMDGARVRVRILVGDLSKQRELVDLVESDDLDAPSLYAPLVAAAVEQDAREPLAPSLGARELLEVAIAAEQALLNDVFGLVADQTPSERIQTGKLTLGECPEAFDGRALCLSRYVLRHGSTSS